MKKKNKWVAWVLSFLLMATYMMPSDRLNIYAAEGDGAFGSVTINKVSQNQSSIQPGDTFSLVVEVTASKLGTGDNKVYISNAKATGSGIDASKTGFSVSGEEEITGVSLTKTITISGLVYNGGSKDIEVVVEVGGSLQTTSPDSNDTESYTLSAKSSEDFVDVLTVEKQDNLLVKTGQTQNVEVKVTNKGTFTVNQADMKLALGSKVEGVEIKTSTATVKNIKSKETKTGIFTIKVSEDAKAGVYPATVSVAGNSYSVNIQVDSSVVPSALEVSTSGSKIYTPGVASDVTFKLSNVGQRDAKNIRFEVVNSENVSIVEASNVKRLDIIQGKASQDITMKLRVNSSFKGDSVPIQIKVDYLNSSGEKEEDTQYVYLSTSASSIASEVIISNVISPTDTYGVDQNFTVKFNVSSKSGADNLKISVKGDEGIVPKSQNLFFVTKLGKGETKQYSVTFAATHAAITSSHPIEINVEYGDAKAPTTISQYGSVNISNPKKDAEGDEDEKLKGKPKVIIGEYIVNPTIVQAGENFELHLGFLNTNSKHTVNNLKANIKVIEQGENQTGNVFTPVGGSNTFYIDQLSPGETVTKDVTMYTIPTAKAKTYEITLEMAYEDEDGNEITATENIGIPVEQVTKIEAGDIFVEYAQVGIETTLSTTFYNRGRTDVTNMMVYVEGEGFTVENNRTFIGNFKQGDSQTYEPMITANQAGTLKGEVIVEYEDAAGKTQEIRKPFEFLVEEMMMEEMPPVDGEMPPVEGETPAQGPVSKKWILAGVGVGVVVAVAITLVMLKKKKAKKEEMMLDEED